MDYIDKYCVVTESSSQDNIFARTHTSIYSFIKHNDWFDGRIIILVSEGDNLKENQKYILDQLYTDIQIIEVLNTDLIELKTKISLKKIDKTEILNFFYVYSLKIRCRGLIYFSRNVVFSRSASIFLANKGSSFANVSGTLPDGGGSAINTSVFYIAGESLGRKLYERTLKYLVESSSIFSQNTKSSSLIMSLNDLNIEIHRLPMICAVNANCFKNRKYREFVRYSKKIVSTNFNTLDSEDLDFSRINLFWTHVRAQSLKFKPSKVDTSKLVKRAANRLPIPIPPPADPNKSVYRKGDRLAVCTICDDNFIKGAEVMIQSFMDHNKWFNGDIIVMYSDRLSPISPSNMIRLKSINSSIIFKKVNESDYSKAIDKFVNRNGLHLRFMPSLFTFETFSLSEYDAVCYIDSDIIHINSMEEFFITPDNFVVTPASLRYPATYHREFSGGMFMVRGNMLNRRIKESLIEFSIHTPRFGLLDQTIMNEYFKSYPKKFAHNKFNCSKRCFDDSSFRKFNMSEVCLIHYVSEKPWNSKTKSSEMRYTKIERIWTDYYNNRIEKNRGHKKPKVIVLGNSPLVSNYKVGKSIDQFDIVVRVNDFRINGYEKYVGTKTDFVITSFATNFKTEEYNSIRPSQVMMSLFDKATQVEFLRKRIERYNLDDVNILGDRYYTQLNQELGISGRNKRCSSGTIAIQWALDNYPECEIYVHGIDLTTHSAHYFNQPDSTVLSWKKSIDTYHSFDREKLYIQNLVDMGAIKKLVI